MGKKKRHKKSKTHFWYQPVKKLNAHASKEQMAYIRDELFGGKFYAAGADPNYTERAPR